MLNSLDDLLDAVKQKHHITSDYRLAKFTGMTTNTIANYRHGRSRPDDSTLSNLAFLADVPGPQVEMLALKFHMERMVSPDSRRLWEGIERRLNYSQIL